MLFGRLFVGSFFAGVGLCAFVLFVFSFVHAQSFAHVSIRGLGGSVDGVMHFFPAFAVVRCHVVLVGGLVVRVMHRDSWPMLCNMIFDGVR